MENIKKSATFDTYYRNNAATIYLYKSSRKNAKIIKSININHLINQEPDRKIKNDRILEQLIGVIDSIVSAVGKQGYIEISVYSNIFKQTKYINANNDIYCETENLPIDFKRKYIGGIENTINFIYMVFMLIYPYNTLNLREVHQNPSIRYLIKQYYYGITENN